MSFYVYYGKLESELIVAVLPNGTVEHADPIYLYTKRRFSSLKVKDVSVTEDGEDRVAFNDGFFTYEALSKKSYKELDLSVKPSDAKALKVTLTRLYDQPLTAIPLSDPPKIWTGAINFHKWAKNESFFTIAPKGLGNGKPIVTIWQWSEDRDGVKDTLSYSTAQQQSEATSPTAFSFKQNGYYELICKVNTSTDGLNVTIKSPSNPDAPLKELTLSAKIEIGAEHTFAPPRASQQKISLDCSLPRAAPSLPRVTGALPFPADLIETLSYSAAYVDQAGYLAKYAVKQFDQLDKSFHQLEKKAEARAGKIIVLEGQIVTLVEKNRILTGENKELQRQLEENRAAAEKRQAELEKQLKDALVALAKSQAYARGLEAKNKSLEIYIGKDKLEDIKRQKEWIEHDNEHRRHEAEDHEIMEGLHKKLAAARATIQAHERALDERNKRIVSLEAKLKSAQQELSKRDATIIALNVTIGILEQDVTQLKKHLADETHLRENAEKDLAGARTSIEKKDSQLTSKTTELQSERKKNENLRSDLDKLRVDLKQTQASLDAKIIESEKAATDAETEIARLEKRIADEYAYDRKVHGNDYHDDVVKKQATPAADLTKTGGVQVSSTEIHI